MPIDTAESRSGGLSSRISGLVTPEDPWHVHKTLGILCLLSYAWRFTQWGAVSDMGFGAYPALTPSTLLLHLLLNVSSFGFRIPARRIASGFRIWPEYRIHSAVFLCRSLASMLLTWYETRTGISAPDYRWNWLIVMSTMAAADYGSSLTTETSGFARKLDASPATRYFFSVMQFGATANSLYGIRRYSLHFVFCMIIQVNAFLMTIRRKNLASHAVLVSLYGAMLATGFGLGNLELMRLPLPHLLIVASASVGAAALRMGPRVLPVLQNKYVLWTVIWCLMQVLRPNDGESKQTRPMGLIVLFVVTHIAVVTVGVYKCRPDKRA